MIDDEYGAVCAARCRLCGVECEPDELVGAEGDCPDCAGLVTEALAAGAALVTDPLYLAECAVDMAEVLVVDDETLRRLREIKRDLAANWQYAVMHVRWGLDSGWLVERTDSFGVALTPAAESVLAAGGGR